MNYNYYSIIIKKKKKDFPFNIKIIQKIISIALLLINK